MDLIRHVAGGGGHRVAAQNALVVDVDQAPPRSLLSQDRAVIVEIDLAAASDVVRTDENDLGRGRGGGEVVEDPVDPGLVACPVQDTAIVHPCVQQIGLRRKRPEPGLTEAGVQIRPVAETGAGDGHVGEAGAVRIRAKIGSEQGHVAGHALDGDLVVALPAIRMDQDALEAEGSRGADRDRGTCACPLDRQRAAIGLLQVVDPRGIPGGTRIPDEPVRSGGCCDVNTLPVDAVLLEPGIGRWAGEIGDAARSRGHMPDADWRIVREGLVAAAAIAVQTPQTRDERLGIVAADVPCGQAVDGSERIVVIADGPTRGHGEGVGRHRERKRGPVGERPIGQRIRHAQSAGNDDALDCRRTGPIGILRPDQHVVAADNRRVRDGDRAGGSVERHPRRQRRPVPEDGRVGQVRAEIAERVGGKANLRGRARLRGDTFRSAEKKSHDAFPRALSDQVDAGRSKESASKYNLRAVSDPTQQDRIRL
ncbi:hypothetical protein EKPJFOCH_4210 [Methylobacterium thuringiense]|uniref:Uncharacterized protein n=1 Tax=Methylobacterium thuringiense TaxID=1003091 RepID=A0ABQ4TSJ6_9HYPH|nr:hypothetical protein EKPJFOCH_4210 [Methylobacterium thuringiense]